VYFGESDTRLDDKGRITVPRRFRDLMDVLKHRDWYLTRGFDRCVVLYPHEGWKSLVAQIQKQPPMHAAAIDFKRLFLGGVSEVQIDNQGRMAIASHLREYAGIEHECVLLGLDDHLELWSKDAWRAFQDAKCEQFRDMASVLFSGPQAEGATTEGETVG